MGRATTFAWDDAAKRRHFMEAVKEEHRILEPQDWRRVTSESIRRREGGSALLARYSYSIAALLQDCFPEECLEAHVVRKKVPNGYWDCSERRKAFMERLAKAHGIEEVHDWKRVSTKDVRDFGGGSLLLRYPEGSAVFSLIRELLPHVEEEQCRPRKRQGYWKHRENRRRLLDGIAERRGVRRPKDWSTVTVEDLRQEGCSSLLAAFNWSVEELLKDTYPEWGPEDLAQARVGSKRNHWSDPTIRRAFMDDLAKQSGVKNLSDWRKVTTDLIRKKGGNGLLQKYGNSVMSLLVATYGKEMEGRDTTVRDKRPKAHWDNMANQRAFLEKVKAAHGIERPEDWRRVTVNHLSEMGGASVLQRYPSFHVMLQTVFPEETFEELTCRPVVPPSYWRKEENVTAFAKLMKTRLKLKEKEDWYRVSLAQIRRLGGAGLLRAMRYVDVLRMAFPEEEWDEEECSRRVKKSVQRLLCMEVKHMLPQGLEVLEDFWHPHIAASHGGKGLEFDVFLPEHKLALEYNGEHHYQELGFFGPVEAYQIRDREKQELCRQQGITLVVVPYWWDQQAGSLAATLHKAVPSLPIKESLLQEVKSGVYNAIPEEDPEQREKSGRAGVWNGRSDPKGLWQCRRYEGVAVRYEPCTGTIHARSSRRTIPVPPFWLAKFPPRDSLGTAEVEGELWSPAHSVGQLSGLLFRLSSSVAEDSDRELTEAEKNVWGSLRFMATDVANLSLPFSERVRLLETLPTTEAFAPVKYTLCGGREELTRELEEDHAAGGAGFLLRDGASRYRLGTQSQAVKKAKHVSKAEALVVERCKDVRGIVVQLPTNGKLQVARCSALEYMRPPAKGSTVLLGHMGTWPSTGRLKHPFLLRTNV